MIKKILPLLLCVMMFVSAFAVSAFAAGTEPNITVSIDKIEVKAGDEINVTLGIKEMTGTSVTFGFDFDPTLMEVDTIPRKNKIELEYNTYDPDYEEWYDDSYTAVTVSTKGEANESGHVGVAFAYDLPEEAIYYANDEVMTITFIAIKDGTVELEMFENSAGTDGYKGTWTVPASAPACDHIGKTYTYTKNEGADTHMVVCECGETVKAAEACSGGKATCTEQATCDECKQPYGEKDLTNHTGNNDTTYEHIGGTWTHTVIITCMDCTDLDPISSTTEDCVDNDGDKMCDNCYYFPLCKHDGETYSLSTDDTNHDIYCSICNTKIGEAAHTVDESKTSKFDLRSASCCSTGQMQVIEYCVCGYEMSNDPEVEIPATGEHTLVKHEKEAATCTNSGLKEYWECENTTWIYTDAAGKNKIDDNYTWGSEGGDGYIAVDPNNHAWGETVTGWYEINGDYYYGENSVCGNNDEHINHTPVTGLTRVPYNTELGHEANAEDMAYWEAHKDTSKYTDAETAVYVFGEDGKLNRTTGIVDGNRYAVDGVIAWNVGLVEVNGEYYYFGGDVNGNGNVMMTGKVYATRDYNSEKNVGTNVVYTFGTDGKLIKSTGVAEFDGTLYYFNEDNSIALGAGLVKLDGGYIYVRSNGQLVADADYYIPANDLGIVSALYHFDENGYMVEPKSTDVNGIVEENGVLYYYVNGKLNYAGLIEIDGETYYIKSNGQVATGTYYVTKVDNYNGDLVIKSGDKLVFDDEGKLQPIKNGIVKENGVLYYYENNHIVYGAGVVELTDDAGATFYIYVKSNGQLATGKYWPTTRNGYLVSGEYDWGTDGRYYPAD